MKVKYINVLGLIALTALPLVAMASDQPASTGSAAATVSATAPTSLSPSAAEVVRLAQSGVGNDVVLAYIKNSRAPFNLSSENILTLKNQGISSSVVTAMLTHDGTLRNQNQGQTVATAQTGTAAPATSASPSQVAPQSVAPQATSSIADAPSVAPASTVASAPTVVAPATPPPVQVEVVPVAPGPDYVWTPGYWSWRDGGWIWIGGVWAPPPPRPHIGIWIGPGPRRGPPPGHWRHW